MLVRLPDGDGMKRRNVSVDLSAAGIAALYVFLAVLWLLLSDRLAGSGAGLTRPQIAAWGLYISATAGVLYGLARLCLRRAQRLGQTARHAQDRYESLLQTQGSPGKALVVLDLEEQRLLNASEAFARITDYNEAELLALPSILDLVRPEDRATLAGCLQAWRDGQSNPDFATAAVLDKRGEPVHLEWVVHQVYTVAGRPRAILFVRDVTVQRRAEEALRESEERYRQLLEMESDAIFLIDNASGQVLEANAAAAALYGYSRDELRSKRNTDLSAEPEQTRQATGEERALVPVRWHRKCDGTVFPVEITARHFDWRGRRVHIAAIRDITERMQMEEALRQSEGRYRLLFETMAQGVVYQAADGRIILANPAAEHILGVPLDQMLGRTSMDPRWHAIREDGAPFPGEAHPAMVALRTGREVQNVVMGVFNPQRNEYRWILVHAVPQFNPGEDKPYQVYTTFEDITAHKQTAVVLARRVAQLEMLNDVSRQIAAELDLERVLKRAASLVQERFGYHHVAIFTLDREREDLHIAAIAGDFVTLIPADICLKLGEGMVGWVALHGEMLLANDVSVEPRYINSYPDVIPTRSELSVPIRVGGETVGVLDIQSPRLGAFDENDVVVMQTLADQLAVVVENARLFQTEWDQRRLAEALQETAAAVSGTLHLDEVLDRILEQVEHVIAGHAFNIMLIEEDSVRTVRQRGYAEQEPGQRIFTADLLANKYPTLQRMARTGEPLVIPDTAADPDWVVLPGREWLRSYVAAPICVGGVVIGFMNVDGVCPGQFGPADARALAAFASHAAAAIHNARLYQELRTYVSELEERVRERTAQIHAQYTRLEAVLHSTSDGILVTDAQGEIVQANPVAQAWLTQTLAPEDAARLQEMVHSLARRAEQRPEEYLELKGLDLQLSAAPILGPVAEEAVVIALHDVTHLKSLDRLKSRFVSNVSHELRTPITTAKLYVALLRRSPTTKHGQYLDVLERELGRQERLVENILRLSRIDAGRLEIDPQPTSLNHLVGEAAADHQALAAERGLALHQRLAAADPRALVDPDQIAHVFTNLLMNAIRYTPQGGEIEVSTGRGERDGRAWATVTVQDTGIGIPENELPHVFERFFRGAEAQRMQTPGTGLGLSIVKEIVELHGGLITVQSQVGVGTAFTVWLPPTE